MSSLAVSFEQDYARRFHGVEIQHGVNPTDISRPYDNNTQAQNTAEHIGSMRSHLFSEITSDMQGIDIDAIDDYFRLIGLPRKDFIIIRPEDLATYNQITAQYGWPNYPTNTEDGSFFYGICPIGTELAVVLRDKEAEATHGTSFTEGHLVHELAHASSDWNEWTINKHSEGRTLTVRRLGQIVINLDNSSGLSRYGDYLEEAFAATVQANYLESQGKVHGYKNYPDIAAEGLARLCAQTSDLFPAMMEARQSVEGLRLVAQNINKIHPRLYARLQKIAYTKEGFTQATQDIQELLS